ncbi:MAG: KamA family radical SAM protein [Lachnospiraceae bacterium]|nr:KamA family radical SAM protein [Lachnospiraceae bacterium]MDD3615818.1 KamA family radical SAM protein [Lachnospiraceae bacterium]
MNWSEQLRHNITTVDELQDYLHYNEDEYLKMQRILKHFPMSITQYYLSLIDWEDESDPIRRMCIPSVHEIDLDGQFDTSGESSNTVMEGLQHKYSETALILSTNRCATYCRHCFRKRLVGLSEEEIASRYLDQILEYIESHKEISNVLISGGDALLNSNMLLKRYLEQLSHIEHLDFIRIGTRTPVVLPMRIYKDEEFLGILKHYNKRKQIYIVTHFNHPKEITPQSTAAVAALLKIGIPVRNQTVLLKGVNDASLILGTLLKELTAIGVLPYYVFQCRPVTGVKNQFQVPLEKGYAIVEAAKNMQNGIGKNFRYVLSHETGKIEILGPTANNRMIFKYHQAKYNKDSGRIFTCRLTKQQCWLNEIPDPNS